MDERIKTLAYNLVHFSCKLEKGEKVWISCNGVHPLPLVKQIIKETYRVGAIPFVKMMTNSLERELLLGATEEQQKIMAEVDCRLMEQMDAFIGVRGEDNLTEQYDVPTEKIDIQNRLYDDPVHHRFVCRTQNGWCCATPQTPWRSPPRPLWRISRISILMYAIWITAKWVMPWSIWWN